MKDLEKSNHLVMLYELYHQLLTEKQQNYFEQYFFDDYSLSEIADEKGVSRNAVYDSLLKITVALNKFENGLHLLKKQQQRDEIYQKFKNMAEYEKIILELQAIDSE
ncbi:hypothetical protein SSYRP_v1c01220 [Spiroplasma syrphidicola EA-1]|uniref:UPF0122 protein SSYRP_v1c01220 n=1 Tax=Spiroplasma syrphidicola EA-1 TaxID=1276229 RepID=R4U578_9MOLU|nr:sigma factor-like helix-turn-helix DNA-binding protein [Spiroplasma syrphidicola]AGM25718.1 hypothetical protein SSYRP_v1c01220 [Spiroplasma syrphidicola EA-1]